MNRNTFNRLLAAGDFRELFISEMGWNQPQGQTQLPLYNIDDVEFDIHVVAQRNGFQILTAAVAAIPKISVARKLDSKLRRQANDYILIFTIPQSEHHGWVCPVKNAEKRELVSVEYAELRQADFLFSKMDGLCFDFDETTTIIDVRERVQKAFAVNSEKITKDFYSGFRKEHKAFASFIEGIDIDKDKQWYTSVMLNRLMFCYFIQKKGFLNGDVDYLTHKLAEVQELRGENKFFHTFYLDFLIQLFHDGLNSPRHTPEFIMTYGRIPYLNGGMFDIHLLEQKYTGIDIPDEAFERLFAFFDTWQWHLDTRITASGKDINPDVLGYIFEQYINDRAAMGAYYTKEDITEYIAKNCILPFLFDRVADSSSRDAFKPNGEVWTLLRNSGMKYIYDAVKKGYTPDWQQHIPANIAQGIDTNEPNLLERRKDWNTPTSEQFALPTEIWRETIERFQRCDTLVEKIGSGSITAINDFITLNLNIRQFTEDLLANTQDHHIIANFYHALKSVTILDPTCGSGAFLFAAMGILEPLYETCINRMQEFHAQNANLFKEELEEIARKYRSNIQYFIYKSIILRNLYGVDIMVEATEIAKLRLFLKMVAVVEVDPRADNMGLDPLPDIDFNIRCGNTLVGYATEQEMKKSLVEGDMFACQEFKDKVESEMKIVATTYKTFKQLQMVQEDDMTAFKEAKHQLRDRLSALNDLLNRHMYGTTTNVSYEDWLDSHQPFHWLAEFYDIIQGNGGFDVIIGNPPYVEYKKDKFAYNISGYNTIECGNLYAFIIEKSFEISNKGKNTGFIIPSASVATPRMKKLTSILAQNKNIWTSIWDERPGKLFDVVDQQLSIQITSASCGDEKSHITRMRHFTTDTRGTIFQKIRYATYSHKDVVADVLPKIGCEIELSLLSKLKVNNKGLSLALTKYRNNSLLYYKNAGGRYWRLVKSFPTYFSSATSNKTTTEKEMKIDSAIAVNVVSLLSSSCFYWFWRVASNCRHLTNREINSFPVNDIILNDEVLKSLGHKFEESLKRNKKRSVTKNQHSGTIEQDFYFVKLSKPIIDEIDKVLAKHYGFTDEELDFIINYDIKYRMGDELNSEG